MHPLYVGPETPRTQQQQRRQQQRLPRHRHLLRQLPAMAAARRGPALLALLALPALAAASEPAPGGSDRVVGALLGVLLCLAAGLALAWRHLCRLSAGRYHPRPLGRRALALLRGRLRAPGARGLRGDGDEEGAPRRGDEELVPWPPRRHGQREEEEEDGEQEEQEEGDEEEEEETTVVLGTETDDASGAEPPELDGTPPSVGQAAGGSAEALLSDLHAFSGTAAWGEPRPHVTAL